MKKKEKEQRNNRDMIERSIEGKKKPAKVSVTQHTHIGGMGCV